MPSPRRLLAWLSFALVLPASVPGAELRIFAAASLSDALKDVAESYETASGDRLVFNLGGSNLLARQIKEGASADVFFSADEARMDELAKAGLVVAGTRKAILSNTLVIIVNARDGAAVASPADLAKDAVRRLALAEPDTVPAGIYAKEFLRKAGLWERLSGRVVATENVRACLAAVESGNVDAGIVYKTDALVSRKVRPACEVPRDEGPRIVYPAAVVTGARHAEASRAFVSWLSGAEARAIFARHGFLPPPDAPVSSPGPENSSVPSAPSAGTSSASR